MVRSSAAGQVVEPKLQHMFFRNLIENEKNPDNVIPKMDFERAFNSLKRDKMLDTVFRK